MACDDHGWLLLTSDCIWIASGGHEWLVMALVGCKYLLIASGGPVVDLDGF